jgi:hypothetical protein
MSTGWSKEHGLRLDGDAYRQLQEQVLKRGGWRCQNCGNMRGLQCTTSSFEVTLARMPSTTSITLCQSCHGSIHNSKALWAHKIGKGGDRGKLFSYGYEHQQSRALKHIDEAVRADDR